MGSYKLTVLPLVLIGSKTDADVTTGIELESTYQSESATEATKTFKVAGFSKANFNIAYTMGATETGNSIEMRLESSPDRVNFYRFTTDSTSSGTSTMSAREFTYVGINAAVAKISIPVDIYDNYVRVAFKETEVATNKGDLFCEVSLIGQ
jgi:hypothetical protein